MKKENVNYHLDQYLGDYIANHNYKHAVLINGKWGTGKTFYIREKIKEWEVDKKVNSDGKIFKPLYVSLYGLNKLSQINEKLKDELHPIINSKAGKKLRKVAMNVVKIVTRTDLDLDGNGKDDGQITYNINALAILKSDEIKGSKILVFDDLERCKVDLNLLFGYLNEFVEHYKCKVILLANEAEISKEEKERIAYNRFKEKLIGQTFLLSLDTKKVIDVFLERVSFYELKEVHKKNLTLIKDVFKRAGFQNLRVLNQALNDFHRFCLQIDVKVRTKRSYKDYVKHLAVYFFAMYFEYKGGNKDKLEYYSNREFGTEYDIKIYIKYEDVISKHNIYHFSHVVEMGHIYFFIENGYNDAKILNEYIQSRDIFKEETENNPLWKRLRRWEKYELGEEEFKELYNQVLDDFSNGKVKNIHILLHHLMILLDIDAADIFPLKNKESYIEKYKNLAKGIIDSSGVFQESLTNLSWGYYQDYIKEKVQKKILSEINPYIKEYNWKRLINKVKEILENINDENVTLLDENISDVLDKLPYRRYEFSSISSSYWKHIDVNIFFEKIVLIDNNGIKQLIKFLWDKVENNIDWFYSEDLAFYKELKGKIESEIKNQKQQEKYMRAGVLADFRFVIDKCIEKAENYQRQNTAIL